MAIEEIGAEALRAKELRGQIQDLASQIAALNEQRRELEAELGVVRERLKVQLEENSLTQARGEGWEVVIAPAGGNPAVKLLVPADKLPSEYVKLQPNLDKLAADIKAGKPEVFGIAQFAERKTVLYVY